MSDIVKDQYVKNIWYLSTQIEKLRRLKDDAMPTKFPFSIRENKRKCVTRPDVPPVTKAVKRCHEESDVISRHSETPDEKLSRLENELKVQREAAALFQKERDHLKGLLQEAQAPKRYFSINDVKNDASLMSFYTGFSSYEEFKLCVMILNVGEKCCNMKYVNNKDTVCATSRNTRRKRLTPE